MELKTLDEVENQVAKWAEGLPFGRYKREDCIVRKNGRIVLKLFTERNEYDISARPKNDEQGRGYLGCIARCRKPRAGETHRRGNDLPDGPLNEETWISILKSIVGYELVEIHKPVEYLYDGQE